MKTICLHVKMTMGTTAAYGDCFCELSGICKTVGMYTIMTRNKFS